MPGWLFPVLGGGATVLVVAVLFLVLAEDDDTDDRNGALIEDEGRDGSGPADDVGVDDADGVDGSDGGADDEPLTGGSDDPDYDPLRLTGTWEGTYDCGDGEMDLVLTVDDFPDETGVGANWWFEPDTDDEGMFYLEGTYENGDLSLEAYQWDEYRARDDYDWHDLEADLSGFTGTEPMVATVPGDDCDDITLERTSQDPWYVGVFEGSYLCGQGITGATLTVEPITQDTAYAFWEFYDIGQADYTVPYGSSHRLATYENRSLRLTLDRWERQPEGYGASDIYSWEEAGTHPDRFHGYLDLEECGLIGLNRAEERDAASDAEDADADDGD